MGPGSVLNNMNTLNDFLAAVFIFKLIICLGIQELNIIQYLALPGIQIYSNIFKFFAAVCAARSDDPGRHRTLELGFSTVDY